MIKEVPGRGPSLVSHPLTPHWPQHVTWLSPKSRQTVVQKVQTQGGAKNWGHVCSLPHRALRGAEALRSGHTDDEVAEITGDDWGERRGQREVGRR